MEKKFDLKRKFLFFENEDSGYEAGKQPSGYVKLEMRNDTGKLWCSVQNLKEASDKYIYKLYMLIVDDKSAYPLYVGVIPLKNNKGEICWQFNPHNVSNKGYGINEFGVAAVLVEFNDVKNTKICCPLAAYRDSKVEWRSKIQNNNDENSYSGTENVQPSMQEIKKEEIIDQSTHADKKELVKDIPKDNNCLFTDKKQCAMYVNNSIYNPCAICSIPDTATKVNQADITGETGISALKKSFDMCFEEYDPFRSKRKDYKWWKVNSPVLLNNILFQCNIRTPLLFNPDVMMAHFKYRHLIIGIYSDQNNDQNKKREYLVCGIPGALDVDNKPFGDICRWVQLEDGKPEHGVFGYWIVYIEPQKGKLLNLK